MTVISTYVAVPSRLRILYGMLHAAGDKGLTRKEMEDAVAPELLLREDNSSEVREETGSNLLEGSLRELRATGLAEIHNQRFILKQKPVSTDPNREFLIAIERELLSPDVDIDGEKGSLAGAISWLLAQDPLEGLAWAEAPLQRLREDLGRERFDITNNQRWQNTIYWARFLGYCTVLHLGKDIIVVPDPTVALRRYLNEMLTLKQVTVQSFLRSLAVRVPVFEEGAARRAVEALMMPHRGRDAHTLSPSTVLALRRLVESGSLHAIGLADADRWATPGIGDGRISHLSRN
jgi:hypothetical protein